MKRQLSGRMSGYLSGNRGNPTRVKPSCINNLRPNLSGMSGSYNRREPGEFASTSDPRADLNDVRTKGNVLTLAGGLRVKARVQHPRVTQRKDRPGWPWMFRYTRMRFSQMARRRCCGNISGIGPSKGEGAFPKSRRRFERDQFLAKLNAPNNGRSCSASCGHRRRTVSARWRGCISKATSAAETRSQSRPAKRKSSTWTNTSFRGGGAPPEPGPAEGG